MSRDDACSRAREALSEVCGDDRFNTVFIEVVAEQGRSIDDDDLTEFSRWAEEAVDDRYSTDDLPREARLNTRDVFVIPGTARPQESKRLSGREGFRGGEASVFSVSAEGRMHAFFPFENNTLQTSQIDAITRRLREAWEDSSISIGRGLNSINVVDPAVARAAAPQRVGRPMEDVERL